MFRHKKKLFFVTLIPFLCSNGCRVLKRYQMALTKKYLCFPNTCNFISVHSMLDIQKERKMLSGETDDLSKKGRSEKLLH